MDVLLIEHPVACSIQEIVELLKAQEIHVPTVALTMFARGGSTNAMLGTSCVVTGRDSPEMLAEALRVAAAGGLYYSETCQYNGAQAPSLTPRQHDVLKLIVDGASTKEVASHLGLSVKTADHHRTRLMKKLNVHSAVELVRFAINNGLAETA